MILLWLPRPVHHLLLMLLILLAAAAAAAVVAQYVFFGPGKEVPVFDLGDLKFGITICYDSHFPVRPR